MNPLTDKMKGKMTIVEEDDSPLILDDVELQNNTLDTVLVARVLTTKSVFLSTFQKQMKDHWNGRFQTTITEKPPDLFVLSFGCEGDKQRVLLKEPYHFQNHHIVLYTPSVLQKVTSDDLIFSPFWVQCYRLPFLSKSKTLAKALGNIIGEFLEVHEDSLEEGWGPFLRFRVKLNVTKPLLRGRNIQLRQTRDKFWVDFRYERLPEWCMECGRLGHPFQKCMIWMEKIDNGIEPELPYGPELKGAALPTSGYDRYRTDFSKGNAWPLLTRLARNSITSAVPAITRRPLPQPCPLLQGESSEDQQRTNNLTASVQSRVSTMGSNMNITATVTSQYPISHEKPATTAMLSSSLVNSTPATTVKFTPALLNGLVNKQSDVNFNNVGSSPTVLPTTNHAIDSVDVDDLSNIFIPDIGTIATYPPNPTLTHAPHHCNSNQALKISTNVATDAVVCSSVRQSMDKENASPNRFFKRQSDNISLRKTLKRCRGPTQAMYSPNLSTREDTNLNVSEQLEDQTGFMDNTAEADSQPRSQP
uniref:Zinc knuckle CX2CX4HX4C domain-containing protein n=1 Tax=Cannabis sativa TaxID=3483 RepID=A0A803NW03_CANSA